MLQEGKGPINFTVFLTLFGEKLNGEPGAGLEPPGQAASLNPAWTPPGPCPPRGCGAHPCFPDPWALVTQVLTRGWKRCFQPPLPNPESQSGLPLSGGQPILVSLGPEGHFVSGNTLSPPLLGRGGLPLHPGSLLDGVGELGTWVLTCALGLPGTDPEEAILSAFRMFDPSGKGVVNKDE